MLFIFCVPVSNDCINAYDGLFISLIFELFGKKNDVLGNTDACIGFIYDTFGCSELSGCSKLFSSDDTLLLEIDNDSSSELLSDISSDVLFVGLFILL